MRRRPTLNTPLNFPRRLGALSLELRAATELGRMWAEKGERAKGVAILEPVYERFTEGFDTPDFIDAKSLLDQAR